MARCIYCLREGVKFGRQGEHVVSQFLGSFENAPTFNNDYVCEPCNTALSVLESAFAEGAFEGQMTIQLAARTVTEVRPSRRLKVERTISTTTQGVDLDFFQRVFPLIDPQTRQVIFKPQVFIFNEKRNEYSVFFVEELEQLTGSEFRKKKKVIDELRKEGMYIFGDNDYPIEKIAEILKKYGVKYEEKERKQFPQIDESAVLNVSVQGEIDRTILRCVAKIAFNYFAYCAKESGFSPFLYKNNFDEIRKFILSDEGNSPVHVSNERILPDEKEGATRLIHLLYFRYSKGRIICEISFLGFLKYTVDLGEYPFKVADPGTFGCGHFFDPFFHKIGVLHPVQYQHLLIPLIRCHRDTYGLFKR